MGKNWIKRAELKSIARIIMLENGNGTANEVTIAEKKRLTFHDINELEQKCLSIFSNQPF